MMVAAPTDQRQAARTRLLAGLIASDLRGAAPGHCVRVNYLDRDEAEGICLALQSVSPRLADLHAFVLTGSDDADDNGHALGITADRAIERRNRKQGRLCLFVPSDLVDAAISSLGNSFAEIDGRHLLKNALQQATASLGPRAQEIVRWVNAELRHGGRASDDEHLDLVLAAAERDAAGTLDGLGLELWRVGLIADAGPEFDTRLTRNRRSARLLGRPQRLDAPFRDRIASLKVAAGTTRDLERFFARRPMHDVRTWSRELAEGLGPTFDRWVFPEIEQTDLVSVSVKPFLDSRGEVLKATKLLQPDGPGGSLLAPYGEKEAISVSWVTDPPKPINVYAWQVALVPAGDEALDGDAAYLDLPARDVKGTLRRAKVKLDLDFDEEPETLFCIRVAAVDETGNEVFNAEGRVLAATSDPFYLTREQRPPQGVAPRRRTVPTLAEGRLRTAVESRHSEITLSQPAWIDGRGVTYFSARTDERTILNVALSPLLLELERRTLKEPRGGGRWTLDLDEVQPAKAEAIVAASSISAASTSWADFWSARSTFFKRLRSAEPRDVLEAADWTTELTNGALNYARAYGALLGSLAPGELREALSIDTLLVRLAEGDDVEEAVVVLPTHPLRAAWFASHAALLRFWESMLLRRDRTERSKLVDLSLVHDVRPVNMPAFAHSWADGRIFVFFQNLGFSHGVALPADVKDPLRRFLDLTQILGFGEEPAESDDRRPERLSRHLQRFLKIHPYADPLQIALVNPDQGAFLAESLERALHPGRALEEDEVAPPVPAIDVAAYVLDDRHAGLPGLDQLRGRQVDRRTRRPTDHLVPALATSVHPFNRLEEGGLPGSHLAVISDLSSPTVRAVPVASLESHSRSLSLYGLVARFISGFVSEPDAVRWRYHLVTTSATRMDGHPAGPRFGDVLIELQASLLSASGRLLRPDGTDAMEPALEVRLGRDQVETLERLHASADWVVTVDRFFGVDYYDSPEDPAVGTVARKHLIDYSPEFMEGLGHRMIVTTAWRDEVAVILRRAMEDLGFAAVDSSVRRLLHYLKTVSGRLALQALEPHTGGAAAVSLAAVMAWLQTKHRLEGSVLIPVDAHLDLFSPSSAGSIAPGQQRCDLVLFSLRRGIVDTVFVEVKWRRGPLGNIDDLVEQMRGQMQATGQYVATRFFDRDRVDAALQRAYLANVLRFYCARAQRYGLLNPAAAATLLTHLAQFERSGADLRSSCEGFIVSLEDPGQRSVVEDDLTIKILTARDFEESPDLVAVPQADDLDGTAPSFGTPRDAIDDQAADRAPAALNEDLEYERIADPVSNDAEATSRNSEEEVLELQTVARAQIDDSIGKAQSSDRSLDLPLGPVEDREIRVVLGDGTPGEITWLPSVQGSPHLFITGIPGQGKSWTILRLLTELHRHGVPALAFDFHGQFAAPDSSYVRAATPVVVDAAEGLPFSPFECTGDASATGWRANAHAVSEIFAYVCGLGDIQRDALYTCIRDKYVSYGFGAVGEPAPEEFPTLEDVLAAVEQAERQKRTQNLVARCRPLLEMDIFRPPTGTRSDLSGALRRGLIVDLHRLASDTLQIAAGAFLLRKVYRDMFAWGAADRLRMVIVLDEAHRLAKDSTLPKIMKEGRKFGVAVVVASQGLADFHPDVLGNIGTKIAFRAN